MTPRGYLFIGFGLFVVVMALLMVPSVMSPSVPTFLPTPPGTATDTVTIDAGAEGRWRFFDIERRTVVEPPDTAGWDLAFQRFHVIPRGAIANLGRVSFDEVRSAPDTGYIETVFGRDTVNAATAKWYRYSYFSHLLSSTRDVYAVRTAEGGHAKLELLSYYCPGPTPGCVTFRYGRIGG